MDAASQERENIIRRIQSMKRRMRDSTEHFPSYKQAAIQTLEAVLAELRGLRPERKTREHYRHGKLKARIEASKQARLTARVADDGPLYD